MGKKDKDVDAIIKEDAEVLTAQDEGDVPNDIPEGEIQEISDQDIGDISEIIEDRTKDEEINAIGSDVPTVERPDPGKDEVPLDTDPVYYELERLGKQNDRLRGAIVYLVKSLMTPADLEDFKTLFPGLL